VEDQDYAIRRIDILDDAAKNRCEKSQYETLATTTMTGYNVVPSSCATATELTRIIAAAEALQFIAGSGGGGHGATVHRIGAGLLHGGSPVSYQQQLISAGFVFQSS